MCIWNPTWWFFTESMLTRTAHVISDQHASSTCHLVLQNPSRTHSNLSWALFTITDVLPTCRSYLNYRIRCFLKRSRHSLLRTRRCAGYTDRELQSRYLKSWFRIRGQILELSWVLRANTRNWRPERVRCKRKECSFKRWFHNSIDLGVHREVQRQPCQ